MTSLPSTTSKVETHRKRIPFLLVLLMLMSVSVGDISAQQLYDHSTDFPNSYNVRRSESGPSTNWRTHDSFELNQTATINFLSWQGTFINNLGNEFNPSPAEPSNWQVRIWLDDEGEPASTPIFSVLLDPSEVTVEKLGKIDFSGSVISSDIYIFEFTAPLPVGFTAHQGIRYWLSIQTVSETDEPHFSWISGDGTNNSSIQDNLVTGERFETSRDRAFTFINNHPVQRVFVDWNARVDQVAVPIPGLEISYLRFVEVAQSMEITDTERMEMRDWLNQMLVASADNSANSHKFELYDSFSDPNFVPDEDTLIVNFTDTFNHGGVAYDTVAGGFPGYDRFNERLGGHVSVNTILLDLPSGPRFCARTIFHEIGHALGFRHVEGQGIDEVMDYFDDQPANEANEFLNDPTLISFFTNGVYQVREPPNEDGYDYNIFQNSGYHFRRFVLGDPIADLDDYDTGDWDDPSNFFNRRFEPLSDGTVFGQAICDLLVLTELDDGVWMPIVEMPGTELQIDEIELNIPPSAQMMILGSSEMGSGVSDLSIGTGTTKSPQLEFNGQLDETLKLTLFQFDMKNEEFVSLGEFEADFSPTFLGDVNNDGFVDLTDVAPFVVLIVNGGFFDNADINQDGVVDLLDVDPFIAILSGG